MNADAINAALEANEQAVLRQQAKRAVRHGGPAHFFGPEDTFDRIPGGMLARRNDHTMPLVAPALNNAPAAADRETLRALMADPVFTAAERRRVEVQATSDTRIRAAIAWATTERAARRPCCGAYCSDVCTCLQESAA